MKILVTVKRVVDPYAKVRPSADGRSIDNLGAKSEINPFDEIAVEEAVRQREKLGDVEIVVVSIGKPEVEEQLRKALAMGADRAILIETLEEYDSLSVANELKELVESERPDLILMGKQATDDDNNQTAQMLAAKLDWSQATFASAIAIAGNRVQVTRETDTGEETLEFSLPAVVTTDLRLNEPRYIALPGIIKARSKPLVKRPAATAPTSKTKIKRLTVPQQRTSGRKVATVSELVSALKDLGAL